MDLIILFKNNAQISLGVVVSNTEYGVPFFLANPDAVEKAGLKAPYITLQYLTTFCSTIDVNYNAFSYELLYVTI